MRQTVLSEGGRGSLVATVYLFSVCFPVAYPLVLDNFIRNKSCKRVSVASEKNHNLIFEEKIEYRLYILEDVLRKHYQGKTK